MIEYDDMSAITAQDVYDRLDNARDARDEAALAYFVDEYDEEYQPIYARRANYATAVFRSWKRVADRVKAGGDPLICVMERE